MIQKPDMRLTFQVDKPQSCTFIGTFAYNQYVGHYLKQHPNDKNYAIKQLPVIQTYEIISADYKYHCVEIIKYLKNIYGDKIKAYEYNPFC